MNWFCVQIFLFYIIEFGSLTTSQLMEKVRGLQNLAFQLGLDEGEGFHWIILIILIYFFQ